jgi:hypothetical protein
MNEMVEWARKGNDVIPMFFQKHGRATVSAAVRAAKARGLLVEDRKDGCGNPLYRAPVKAATHAAPQTIN